ncbi:MAG: MATE family efflux transporter [Bacilli bacterium]
MNNDKSLKMRTVPVGRLIATMSLPAMFSMLIQALYNIVDTLYVGRIDLTSDDFIRALGYAFPMQIVILAFSLGVGIGTNVMVAKKLGEIKNDEASSIARTGIAMALIGAVIFFVLSFIIVEPYMNYMSDIPRTVEAGTTYLRIVMMFSGFSIVEIVLTKILQGMGRMIVPMIAQIIGAVTNILLDPIFIFGWFGLPALGVTGAAIATVFGQIFALIFVLIILITKKSEIYLGLKKFRFKMVYVSQIIQVGLPSMVMNLVGSMTNIFLNKIIKSHDPTEVANAVLVSYSKLQSFVFMPIFGLNQGAIPILSYNYGANIKERFMKAQKILYISAVSIMIVGFIIFQVFPIELLKIFSPSTELLNMGVYSLRRISIAFIPAGIAIISTATYQALGKGFIALVMSLSRQLLLLIPSAYILGKIGGIDFVWFSFPIAEVIVSTVFTILLVGVVHKAFIQKNKEVLVTE